MTTYFPTRRGMLQTTMAMGLATPFVACTIVPAAMAEPKIAMRAVHRFKLGEMTISVIDDGRFTFPAPAFATNQPEGTIGGFLSAYGQPGDFVTGHCQVTLVETGGRKVLLDTGMGDFTFPENPVDNGRLFDGLAVLGHSADDITDVVFSHGHPDHVGGCSFDGVPAFKNATYHIDPAELEFWTQKPGQEQNFMNAMLGVGNAKLLPLEGKIKSYRDGDEIAPGVFAVAAPGHTIGHHAFHLKSGGAELLHMMDAAVHYLVGPEEPDWALAVEMNPDAAAATRRSLFTMAANARMPVAGYHFPFPGIGQIVASGNAWRYVPVHMG